MELEKYRQFLIQTAKDILSIDSATGFTGRAAEYVHGLAEKMGYPVRRTNKGNVIVTVEGRTEDGAVALSSHLDTLGLIVRSITEEGGLMVSPVGSPLLPTLDGEYCKIYTRGGKVYTGTILSLSPAIHVFPDAQTRPRDEQNMAVRIDETVSSDEDVLALGIRPGDYVCYDPKTVFTETGFLKSRFIDDKGCAALLLTLLKLLADEGLRPATRTYVCFTVHEEVGHGGATLPGGLKELLVVDMGCVGDDLTCTEQQVSICAKDSGGPYDYEMTSRLIRLAEENGVDYAVDIYPRYTSDAAALWRTGQDTRAALIGPGVNASHGMERTHIRGLMNTFRLICGYLDLPL